MSSDSEPEDPRKLKASQGALRSLFASDRKLVENGPQTLKYDSKSGTSAQSNLPGQQAQTVAAQGMAVVYRGDVSAGPCFIAVMVPNSTNANNAFIVIVNREKKPLCRIKIDNSLQLLINETDQSYATLYDPSLQLHWMMQFKTATDAQNFVVGALTVQHYVLMVEGQAPSELFIDIFCPESTQQSGKATVGDTCHIGYKVWLVNRVGQTGLFTSGKVVEEVPKEAPKSVTIGSNTVMQGIEDGIKGSMKGSKRLIFVSSRKTKTSGLGNPEIGLGDSVVVFVTVNSVDKAQPLDKFGLPQSDSDSKSDVNDGARKLRKRAKSVRRDSNDDLFQPKGAKLIVSSSTSSQPVLTSPAVQSSPGLDTNALLQTVLLQSLQQQQKPFQVEPTSNSFDVQRSVDRLHYQIQSLYDKIDRIDFEKYIQNNNQVIERIVKKAVGKMPVNDVDVEDSTKDRNELLALIEQLKKKNQELTDNYHKALETLGKHKDETAALKNDLLIEREAAGQRYNELNERKRLELVDMEVKHRRAQDKLSETRFEEGKHKGYSEGYAAGKIDAIEISGSSSMEEIKKMLHKKDAETVELQSKIAQLESRIVQERREHNDQVSALNSLIARMEDRRSSASQDFVNDVTSQTKRIRRIMNSVYSSVEEQFYATEKEVLPVADALSMVLVSVKTETRSAIDEIKNEAALRETTARSNRNEVIDAYTLGVSETSKEQLQQTSIEKNTAASATSEIEPSKDGDGSSNANTFELRLNTNERELLFNSGTHLYNKEIPSVENEVPDFVHHNVDEFDFSSLPVEDAAPKTDSLPTREDVDDDFVPTVPFE